MKRKGLLSKQKKVILIFSFISVYVSLLLFYHNNASAQTANTAWPMFRQNPQHTGQRTSTADNEPQIVKEKFTPIETGVGFITDITSSPTIAGDGTIFIGSLAKDFFAIDSNEGKIVGTFTTFNSVFSTPSVGESGNIYVGSWDGILYELKYNGTATGFSLENFVQASSEEFGHLSGVVEDGDLGGPIQGASVSVSGKTGFTDVNGEFFVDNITKGNHEVIVSAGGKDCSRSFSADICGFQFEQSTGIITLHDFVINVDALGNAEQVCPEVPTITVGGCVGIICSNEQTSIETTIPLPTDLGGMRNLRTFNENLLVENGISCSPLIGFNNWVYWGSQNGRFYGWDLDGQCIFFKQLGGPIVASPAQSLDGTVYVITLNGELSAFNPDFSEVFTTPFVAGGEVKSSPAIGIDGTIFFGSLDNNLYAVLPDGTLKWTFPTGGVVISSPAISRDGTIYIGSGDGNLYAIEDLGVENVEKKWEFEAGSEIAGSSASIGRDGTIYIGIGGEFPKLLAVNSEGFLKWCFNTENGITSTPAIDNNGTIFVGSFDGKVYAFENKEGVPGSFSISGKVLSSSDNNSLEDALIELTKVSAEEINCEEPFSGNTRSTSDGTYEIKNIPSGFYNISVSMDGFTSFSEELEDELTGNLSNQDFILDPVEEEAITIQSVSFTSEIDTESCLPLRVKFKNTSSVIPVTAPIEFTWNFGDGETSNLKDPEHEYTETGVFTVELRIQLSGTNLGGTASELIEVSDPPCARFKPLSVKVKFGQAVAFQDLSKTSEGEEVSRREWRFSFNRRLSKIPRENTTENKDPVHEFFRLGEHSVSLFVQQSDGKDDKEFGTVTVVNEL